MPSREAELIPKAVPSSDWRLQFASMKLESLVIAGQHTAVNTFSSLVLTIKAHSSAHIYAVQIRASGSSPEVAEG